MGSTGSSSTGALVAAGSFRALCWPFYPIRRSNDISIDILTCLVQLFIMQAETSNASSHQ